MFIPWPVPLLLRSLINQYFGIEGSLSLRLNHDKTTKKLFKSCCLLVKSLAWDITYITEMNVLLESKSEVETHSGKQATMALSLLDMVTEGERAYGFLLGGN